MATLNRQNESMTPPERSLRYFQRHGYWYYSTREGVDIGPFDSIDDAEAGVDDYIAFITSSHVDNASRLMAMYRAA